MSLLSIRDLSIGYLSGQSVVRAVEGLTLSIEPGETVGLVGESGSGKSTAIKGLLRVLGPPGVILGGEVHFKGQDVLRMNESALRRLRWEEIALVPQSALNSLNPVLTIAQQIADTLRAHATPTSADLQRIGTELMEMVDLSPTVLRQYPHQLSGGQRQRVALSLALVLKPSLIILDEPTTALDVVVEREIIKRLLALQSELGFAMLFITHDLSLLLEFATRIGVLYSGRLVEDGPIAVFRKGGRHPYTQRLLASIPRLFGSMDDVHGIPGSPPSPVDPPPGCRFAPRCHLAEPACLDAPPPLVSGVACHLLEPR